MGGPVTGPMPTPPARPRGGPTLGGPPLRTVTVQVGRAWGWSTGRPGCLPKEVVLFTWGGRRPVVCGGANAPAHPQHQATAHHSGPVSSALPLLEALIPLLLLVLPVLLGGGAAARSRSPSRPRRTAARLLFSHDPRAMARTSFATGRASGGGAARARPRGHSFGADVASAVAGVFFGVHQGENTHSAGPGQMPCGGAQSRS
jgi:hypothetical protein